MKPTLTMLFLVAFVFSEPADCPDNPCPPGITKIGDCPDEGCRKKAFDPDHPFDPELNKRKTFRKMLRRNSIHISIMMRFAIARAISIAGHPVVFIPVAVLIAASTGGASLRQLWSIGGVLATVGVVVLGFSWLQVRAGRWSHIDASVRSERKSLNMFLGVVCLLSAVLLCFLKRWHYMSLGLTLSGTLIVIALLIARWVKVSLHVAFAAFATALLWPIKVALVAGALMTAALVWSRLVLGRHAAADVATGLVLGAAAGGAYHVLVV